jgi:hypothetical protein
MMAIPNECALILPTSVLSGAKFDYKESKLETGSFVWPWVT